MVNYADITFTEIIPQHSFLFPTMAARFCPGDPFDKLAKGVDGNSRTLSPEILENTTLKPIPIYGKIVKTMGPRQELLVYIGYHMPCTHVNQGGYHDSEID